MTKRRTEMYNRLYAAECDFNNVLKEIIDDINSELTVIGRKIDVVEYLQKIFWDSEDLD